MDPKGLLLAGAMFVVSAGAGAEPVSSLHPAEPTGSTASTPYSSAFADAVPLLDRDAPSPSYGPAPQDSFANTEPGQASADEMPTMDHGAMNHGAMNHGTSSSSN